MRLSYYSTHKSNLFIRILLYALLITGAVVVGKQETCIKGCALPPKSGTVVVGTGTYSKSIGRQCPSQKALLRHFVDPVDGAGGENGIDADLQNEVDRAPFNLQNTMVEFQSCKFDNPQPFDLAVSWFKQH